MRSACLPLLSLTLAALLTAGTAGAASAPTQANQWYYRIGGAEPVSIPPNTLINTITLGGRLKFGLGYSCGKFDPKQNVLDLLESFQTQLDTLPQLLISQIQAALAALPMLILQRGAPDLYDLLQTYTVDAQRRVALAMKTCRQMEAEIARGKNPFDKWIQMAKVQSWKTRMADGSTNLTTAEAEVDARAGDDGLAFIKGDQGGLGQPPIEPVRNTTVAGYNVTQNRPPSSSETLPAAGSRLADTWETPADAAQWAVDVLGDEIIRTCQSCTRSTRPGTGLLPKYNEAREALIPGLVDLVSGATPLTFENLDALAAPGIGLSRQLIEAIRAMPPGDQGIVVSRLAGEIAQARTIDRALLLRRTLLTGRKVPEVAGYEVAADAVDRAVSELENEIENLLFETRVRREILSQTASVILGREQIRREAPLVRPYAPPADPYRLEDGRIVPPGGGAP